MRTDIPIYSNDIPDVDGTNFRLQVQHLRQDSEEAPFENEETKMHQGGLMVHF